jgi:hypothetical protein
MQKKNCNQEGEIAFTKGPCIFLLLKVVGIRFLLCLLLMPITKKKKEKALGVLTTN